MKTLASFIADKTPKFNKELVEGLCYNRLKNVVSYVDNYIKYNCSSKTKTHLQYLGYRRLTPKEEIKQLITKANKTIYDIAENDIFPVEFIFKYGEEEDVRRFYMYLPYVNKGNLIKLSGNNFLVAPVLADKVISIGEHIIFINIMTAKYNFERMIYGLKVNNVLQRVPIVITKLYKNQSKKLENTTEAIPTVVHYLLAAYGYTGLTKLLLGFTPKIIYSDITSMEGHVVISNTGVKPKGYIRDRFNYTPSNIKFIVEEKDYNENVSYLLGNIFYLIDNFPEFITIDELDNNFLWKKLLGEIIHSGNHQLTYIMEKINAHFKDLNSNFDNITYQKLLDIDVDANNLLELMVIIFKNFNNWILSVETKTIYNNKAYECELYVLSRITSAITRAVLDISKEELRIDGGCLEPKVVSKLLEKHLRQKSIFGIKKDILYISSVNYSGDHLYPKNTSMVVEQESDPINTNNPNTNISERKKINASMITVGSILGLPKKNPIPIVRLNPYVTTDKKSGTVLPHPVWGDIIERTDKLLNNIVDTDIDDIGIIDLADDDETELIDDLENFESDDLTIED